MNLEHFATNTLFAAMKAFFDQLHVPVNCVTEAPAAPTTILEEAYNPENPTHKLMARVYALGMVSDAAFQGVSESTDMKALSADYDGLLVFGVQLHERSNRRSPTRTQLAEITRLFNRQYHTIPVAIIFRYTIGDHGVHISFTSCQRTAYKQTWRSGEKPGKVSILKDIRVGTPHSGHLRILQQMTIRRAGRKAITSYRDLNEHWQQVFSVSILNKEFYRELFNWYLWACRTVRFNKPESDPNDDKTHTSISVIRMLTRIIFCWFIKEKYLIPEELFDRGVLKNVLREFQPLSGSSSSYYKAILQNLFFATLNTAMPKDEPGSRRFISPEPGGSSDDRGYTNHTLYRYRGLFVDPEGGLKLFERIPFLNGGLFECLDSRNFSGKGEKEIRYDGFSETRKNQPVVPNMLFFGGTDELDLSDEYDKSEKKKHTHDTAKGLIEILSGYKFTIEENTPLEQEIALDPELLGKVFENLLASYNPETRTTARKQTGSFYTPREIVDYMVDESLIAYLRSMLTRQPVSHEELGSAQMDAVGNAGRMQGLLSIEHDNRDKSTEKQIEAGLRDLFDPGLDGNPFQHDASLTDRIVEHLSNCRILDPACGSGAFPMGILHKMVFVLGKLDPDNRKWKEAQRRRAEADLVSAERMQDPQIRDKAMESAKERIAYIEESFREKSHELGYTRKLFLIENCIFGVDIQNIAVQISKLRFFISLMLEQAVSTERPNMGILSLPNLETKFVAANTLLGLGTQVYNIGQAARKIENELNELRHRIFFTRKYSEKKRLKKLEANLRHGLWDEIFSTTGHRGIADKIAGWNPFDPVRSAPFFHPETMFQTRAFDIVIGNPPYVRQESIKEQKPGLKEMYDCFTGIADLYVYFYERGIQILATETGILSFISSNKYFRSGYGEKLRRYLARNTELLRLIDFGDAPVFDAIAYPSIIVCRKIEDRAAFKTDAVPGSPQVLTWEKGPPVEQFVDVFRSRSFTMSQKDLGTEGWRLQSREKLRLLQKLKASGTPLGEYVKGRFYRGILTGLNEAFVIDGQTRDRLISEDPRSEEVIKPFLRGKDVKRWRPVFADRYLIKIESSENRRHPWTGKNLREAENVFRTSLPAIHGFMNPHRNKLIDRYDQGKYFWELRACAYWQEFEKPKIIYPNICDRNIFAWDNQAFYANQKTFIIPEAPVCMLGVLNSNTVRWLFDRLMSRLQNGFFEPSSIFMKGLPVPTQLLPLKEHFDTESDENDVHLTCTPAHLDALVAHLYRLAEPEYRLILDDLNIEATMREACLREYRQVAGDSSLVKSDQGGTSPF